MVDIARAEELVQATDGSQPFRAERTKKGYTLGTHRSCPPTETWERIKPHFSKTGLTRVADVTGLDMLGIPVTLALRPDSPTMVGSTGKGLTLEAALVSGAMEAMELYHAEHVALPILDGSYDDMARRGAVMALEDLPLTRYSVFSRRWREHWVVGRNLIGGDEIAVPFALVALWDAAHAGPDNLRSFQISSNGLASGNDLAEAIVSALLEVVERDAVTCHKLAEHMTQQPPERVRLETIPGALARDLVARLHDAGLMVLMHDCTTDVEVPVYACHLYEAEGRQVGASLGYGAHLDPEIAMLRALTEAAQSRLVAIAGSRDDIFRRNLHRIRSASSHAQVEALARFPASLDVSELVSEATETFEGDIELLLARLQRVGLSQVIVFDLSRPGFPFAVVRVVVPGLEGHMFEYYTPGRRALALSHTRKREAA